MSRIDKCREAIRQGESYELNQTMSFLSSLESDPYPTYLRLRSFNPAYYSCYLSFPTINTPKGRGVHVISSSPERFLQITGGEIEMRPIKGTARRVKPGECVCLAGQGCGGQNPGSAKCVAEGKRVDFERGQILSQDQKERAENLMVSYMAYALTPDRRPHSLRLVVMLRPVNGGGPSTHRLGELRRPQPGHYGSGAAGSGNRTCRSSETLLPSWKHDWRTQVAIRAVAGRL